MTKLSESHIHRLRGQFPALQREFNRRPAVFFDGPAGTHVPQRVIDAFSDYFSRSNANHGGFFFTSRETDEMLESALQAMADLVGAGNGREIAFGQNMTSLTFALSRALAQTWSAGDEIVVTALDHDANVTPWVLAAQDRGAIVKTVDFRRDDFTLDLEDMRQAITPRTRLVAVGCASNATGGINPVKRIAEWAHAVGALVFLDAVHYGPHGLIDVREWDCDFLTCSTYKFFGPHLGVLWGRGELLNGLPVYKVRPADNRIPWRLMTGTQSHESIAGALACVEYLADIGRELRGDQQLGRRAALSAAFEGIRQYESDLIWQLIDGLTRIEGIKIYGLTDRNRQSERFSTLSFIHESIPASDIATQLAAAGICVWSGNYYALQFTERLGLEPQGMVRIGLMHYNTHEEVQYCLEQIQELVAAGVSS